MLPRAAQTRPSGTGVHAAISRPPQRSGTNRAKQSLPLIKMTGSVLRSDVSIQVQKGKPGPTPPPPINNPPLRAEDCKLPQISGRYLKKGLTFRRGPLNLSAPRWGILKEAGSGLQTPLLPRSASHLPPRRRLTSTSKVFASPPLLLPGRRHLML